MADETHDTTPMSDERLAEIRRMNSRAEVSMMASSDVAVRDLLAEVDRLRTENDTMRSTLADVAKTEPYYSEQPEGWWCTMCDGWQPERWSPHSDGGKSQFQHDKNCPVTKAHALLAEE